MTDSCCTAFVFPGQGSQFVGMGRDLVTEYGPARDIFYEADAALGFSLSRLCFEGPEEELTKTVNVQPAIVTMSLAILAVLRQHEKIARPCFVAGHSLGEYTALAAAGMQDVLQTILLARKRGELMHQAELKCPGAMIAILGLAGDTVSEICSQAGVYIANYNCPGQVVISGEGPKVKSAMELASNHGAVRVVPLRVAGAFHTPMMRSAAHELEKVVEGMDFKEPEITLVGNTDAAFLTTADQVKTELGKQMCQAVQWQRSIEHMISSGVNVFVEIGPGRVLSGLIKRINRKVHVTSIADISTLQDFVEKEQLP